MHDLHTADLVLKLALDEAAKNNLTEVTNINIELGQIYEHGSFVKPENLKYNLKLLSQEKITKNAKISVTPNKNHNEVKLISIEGN